MHAIHGISNNILLPIKMVTKHITVISFLLFIDRIPKIAGILFFDMNFEGISETKTLTNKKTDRKKARKIELNGCSCVSV